MLARAVVLALALAAAPDANAAGDGCREACAGVGNAALVQGCDGCAARVIDDREACVEAARNEFTSCVAACPAFAGFCAITHACVNRCRDGITRAQAICEGTFRSHLRRRCEGGRRCFVTARRARRQCLHGCLPGAPASASPAVVDRCACQQRCIVGIVGGCFADCEDRCEGDGLALAICRRGCRDAGCGPLTDACTTTQDRPRSPYQRCCTACGNCQSDIDCETTSSTTTTSSSTTIASTTTTLPSCGSLGASCGSCGTGICVQHCAAGAPLVCIVARSTSNACAGDTGCSGTTPICAGFEGDPGSCTGQSVGECSPACR
jgi:hypothetical protein